MAGWRKGKRGQGWRQVWVLGRPLASARGQPLPLCPLPRGRAGLLHGQAQVRTSTQDRSTTSTRK